MLAHTEREQLLELVHAALAAAVHHRALPEVPSDLPAHLAEHCGAFVTLTHRHRLRGCIGLIEGYLPLAETVIKMAESAALHDPRFNPVLPEELPELGIEISVLSPLQRAASAEDIVLGRDGVMIKCRGRSGVFLPQVAAETGWSKEKFLSELCEGKAGLPENAWKKPECELYTFTVEIIKA
jgi:AmmeMemoRadiSam system protein A